MMKRVISTEWEDSTSLHLPTDGWDAERRQIGLRNHRFVGAKKSFPFELKAYHSGSHRIKASNYVQSNYADE